MLNLSIFWSPYDWNQSFQRTHNKEYIWRVPVLGGPKNGKNGQIVRQLTGFLLEFHVAAGTFLRVTVEKHVFLLLYTIDGY